MAEFINVKTVYGYKIDYNKFSDKITKIRNIIIGKLEDKVKEEEQKDNKDKKNESIITSFDTFISLN